MEQIPSENEWLVMEVIWKAGYPVTASEVIESLKGVKDVSQKTIRVMINRLVGKGILDYMIDKHDARVYHYIPLKTKEECLEMKSRHFAESYFGGNGALAAANFINNGELSQEQLTELMALLQRKKQS